MILQRKAVSHDLLLINFVDSKLQAVNGLNKRTVANTHTRNLSKNVIEKMSYGNEVMPSGAITPKIVFLEGFRVMKKVRLKNTIF